MNLAVTWNSPMNSVTEKQLDIALENEFKTNPVFCRWFLDHTKFSKQEANYYWSRADHPWGRFPYTANDPATGTLETVIREGETDVLVVFETSDRRHVALHIENKVGAGRFTALQAELYSQRAAHWLRNPNYGNYSEFETVLIAPRVFFERNRALIDRYFDRYISHEDISAFIPLFKLSS
jgi:hypothetical protein